MTTNNKFITLLSGIRTLVTAISASVGVADANKIVATGSDGKLDSTLMPAGIGAATENMIASEALAAGDFINIWLDAGTRKARKADASNGRAAMGFVMNSVAANANATVTLQGTNTALTGLTVAARYYLSATIAGSLTTTSPNTSGQISQSLGFAVSTTSINFEYDDPISIQ